MTDPHTIIFLHIPKTAGTTLNQILRRQYRSSEILFLGANAQTSIAAYQNLQDAKKEAIRLVAGHTAFGFHRFVPGPATYFTFLREPIERVVSFFHYVKQSPQHYLNEAVANELSDISAFVGSGITKMIDNGQTRMISGTWLEPAYGGINAEILQQAKDNLSRYFTVVGLTEEFDASLLLLQEAFNWRDIHYVRQNVTRVAEKERKLSVNERHMIERYNEWDMALYAYAVELMQQQIVQAGPEFAQRLESFRRNNARYSAWKMTLQPTTDRIKRFSIRAAIKKLFA